MKYEKGLLLMDEPHWIIPDIFTEFKGDYAVGYNPVDDCDTIEFYDGDETIGFFDLNPERDFASFRTTNEDGFATQYTEAIDYKAYPSIAERLVRNFKLTYVNGLEFRLPTSNSLTHVCTKVTVFFVFSPTDIRDIYVTYSFADEFHVQHLKSFEEFYSLNIIDKIDYDFLTSFGFLMSSPGEPDFRQRVTEFLDSQFRCEVRDWGIVHKSSSLRGLFNCKNSMWFTFINYKRGSSRSQQLPDDVRYCPHRPTLKITKENYKTYFPDIGRWSKDDELFLQIRTNSLFGDRVEFIDLRDN